MKKVTALTIALTLCLAASASALEIRKQEIKVIYKQSLMLQTNSYKFTLPMPDTYKEYTPSAEEKTDFALKRGIENKTKSVMLLAAKEEVTKGNKMSASEKSAKKLIKSFALEICGSKAKDIEKEDPVFINGKKYASYEASCKDSKDMKRDLKVFALAQETYTVAAGFSMYDDLDDIMAVKDIDDQIKKEAAIAISHLQIENTAIKDSAKKISTTQSTNPYSLF
ncbi:hypothetical protein Dip518_001585 [Parelusimicrobium proximum]|uniref:hypothetical protein n=1 Tax=Parelusimicrobium proximum TaxID=3228953 RepID=UPI003D165CDF